MLAGDHGFSLLGWAAPARAQGPEISFCTPKPVIAAEVRLHLQVPTAGRGQPYKLGSASKAFKEFHMKNFAASATEKGSKTFRLIYLRFYKQEN